MQSDPALTAHSRIRSSSGSSLTTLRVRAGVTKFAIFELQPREMQSVAIPIEILAKNTYQFIENRAGHVKPEVSRTDHAQKAGADAAEFQSRDVDVRVERGAVHSASLRVDSAPVPYDLRHIGVSVSRSLSGFPSIGEHVLPLPLFETLTKRSLGQFIHSFALGSRSRLQFRKQFAGDVDAVLSCHVASLSAYRTGMAQSSLRAPEIALGPEGGNQSQDATSL